VIGSGVDCSLSGQLSTLTASSRARQSRSTGSMSTPMTPVLRQTPRVHEHGGRLTPSPGASAMVGGRADHRMTAAPASSCEISMRSSTECRAGEEIAAGVLTRAFRAKATSPRDVAGRGSYRCGRVEG